MPVRPAREVLLHALNRIIHERFERLGAFVSKTVGAGRLDHTKNAAEANDRARRPKWLRAAFHRR
jgi:hypothetical protein